MDEQQSQKIKAIDDQQEENGPGVSKKKPYETSRLARLGSVQQLTQGTAVFPLPDDAFFSV